MPYVPSKKTDGKSTDREVIDGAVECLANEVVSKISDNLSLLIQYKLAFMDVAKSLYFTSCGIGINKRVELAQAIRDVGAEYDYEGAYLGELNYAITRFIQRVPQLLVAKKKWKDELRYWVYARTVAALIYAARHTEHFGTGIDGVFEDIKDEYKRRVNPAYEAAQILKNGDCYDTPYYTRLIELVDEAGTLIGHQEVMLKRSDTTLHQDLLDFSVVVKKK
ncbi:MAG: hypothetical protein A3B91_01570 [Candidatus Yanofskybacteria bacterium RIFCSPHIGHO2_02_FULL_41_29]|uniref:Uncharacterized protein n=1 Tax=Candidatus Yanofskybacteria bacterium RIFCSPHIGHO2_01_FULL_41_53 TaxID=1802663 RepID=A0A1F8EI22_9BACT|nr:MAG: hypothetical protein A2650_00990 [Candidatus Yanofskybacteria bacterium RIFCSPHIGHO2_01_FULL_41_53]OGN11056.1 MAG: hypothetical protein A3B91_01570 [Candidatus Yanofskybacteria bacterium RIFCSPHIGHO2_02_FULL_41_29]OGN19071.1 MAG: hypothetical protein A3F48_01340 [Candidatus Yanofskybacteria bacterium RIFCSPHIGHO2_12_FULL_41_9]OGN21973.1 MAG: hypothetical protein A2916_03015 [Candidatus Yanofskybacteria bacterium RIFCSPLOWO2_01_FULL_41_67]OGN30248.1 MAG: hypothetical protein A3H54_02695 